MIVRKYFTISDIFTSQELIELIGNEELIKEIGYKYFYNMMAYEDIETYEQPINLDSVKLSDEKRYYLQAKIKYIYDTTKDRYNTLITLYKENENKLMDKLSSEHIVKFNNTPQLADTGDTDEYTTTYSKTENSVDSLDTMSKLDEVFKMYRNLMARWVDEFSGLFGDTLL